MRGLAGGGDDGAEAVLARVHGELSSLLRRAVRAHYADLNAYAKLLELPDGLLHDRPIAVAAHDDGNLFLLHALSSEKRCQGHGAEAVTLP